MLPRSHQSTKISEMAPSTSSPEKSMETGRRQRRRIVLQMLVGRWRSYASWVGGDAGDVEQVVQVQGAEWSAGSDLYGLENICLSFWLIFVYDYDTIL